MCRKQEEKRLSVEAGMGCKLYLSYIHFRSDFNGISGIIYIAKFGEQIDEYCSKIKGSRKIWRCVARGARVIALEAMSKFKFQFSSHIFVKNQFLNPKIIKQCCHRTDYSHSTTKNCLRV